MMNRDGFTLTEILVVTAIMVVLLGMLSMSLVNIHSVFHTTDITANLQANARLAIIRLSADLRRTAEDQIMITPDMPAANTDRLTYHLPNIDGGGDPVINNAAIDWDNDDIFIMIDPGNAGRLIKIDGADTTILANNVESIRFITTAFSDELRIILTLEQQGYRRTHTTTAVATINMRN